MNNHIALQTSKKPIARNSAKEKKNVSYLYAERDKCIMRSLIERVVFCRHATQNNTLHTNKRALA